MQFVNKQNLYVLTNTLWAFVQFGYGAGTWIVNAMYLPANIASKVSVSKGGDVSGYATNTYGKTFWK